MRIYDLTVEHLKDPIGIDALEPRFSWKIESEYKGTRQVAYQILASQEPGFKAIIWNSEMVMTDCSQNIEWSGGKLFSGQKIFWKVIVRSNYEEGESAIACFEMGLLDANDWIGKWIEPEKEIDPENFKPSPFMRKNFYVKEGLKSARAYFTAKGLYNFYLNGSEGTDTLFSPGYTSYYSRLQYQTYDITHHLHIGENTLGVILGDGWWRGAVGAFSFRNNFGYKLAFLGQIHLYYEDGMIEKIGTDESFLTKTGPILKSDLKGGEIYDATREMTGWNQSEFDDGEWDNVQCISEEKTIPVTALIATRSAPVRRKERFVPELIKTPNGETILDYRQNIAGWIEMSIVQKEGTMITLSHGEVLDRDGNFTLKNLIHHPEESEKFQLIKYTARGNGREVFHPHFTLFGFRYVLIKGYEGEIDPEDFPAYAIYSDLQETGTFFCSNSKINQLISNSMWSQKSNFMEVPTDCPTRERAGWTGDAQLYCRSASNFMDVYLFFEKWMSDLKAEQYENGAVGITVPGVDLHFMDEFERLSTQENAKKFPLVKPGEQGFVDGSAGWADAAVIIPWTMFLCYGDKRILEGQYESAKAWVDYMILQAKESNPLSESFPFFGDKTVEPYIWDTKFHFGEWLEADVKQGDAMTDPTKEYIQKALVATAYYGYSSRLLSQMADVLEYKEDMKKYGDIADNVKRVYDAYFIKEDGNILSDRQAPNVRVLAFDLVSKDKKQAVADRLATIIKGKKDHLNTGFLSTPFILKVLVENGHKELAFSLLEQETCPSWLYAVTKGATTIWETWDAISPEGEVQSSMNHYAYGAVSNFLFEEVAGIKPLLESPGYKRFKIEPLIGGSLTEATAEYISVYGKIRSGWKLEDSKIKYHVEIPANSEAIVSIKGSSKELVHHTAIKNLKESNGRLTFILGSGYYEFDTNL